MKFLIVLFSIFAVSFGDLTEKVEPHAVGGVETQWGQFASSVLIDGPNEFCGGTIIDRNHILTAARCLLNENFEIINPIWFRVIAGDVFFSPASFRRVERNVSRIFIHEDYNAFTGEHDVAMLRLGAPLPIPHNTIEAARRQRNIVRSGFQCQLVAFGRATNATTTFRPRQVAVNLNTMERAACTAATSIHANRLFDTQMCVVTTAAQAPCSGNLGSGLYCDGLFTGVLTGGIACNVTPAEFHQVRAYNRWIDVTVARTDIDNEAGTVPFRSVQGLPTRVRRN